MKKEYNLGKLRKRPGKAKVDPDATKPPSASGWMEQCLLICGLKQSGLGFHIKH